MVIERGFEVTRMPDVLCKTTLSQPVAEFHKSKVG